jgi:hypothetical protein
MLSRKVLLVSAAICFGATAPAAACDQHGPDQMGGFHRYNPFASAFDTVQSRTVQSQTGQSADSDYVRGDATRKRAEERRADEEKREQAIDAEAEAEKARRADLRERGDQGRGALK